MSSSHSLISAVYALGLAAALAVVPTSAFAKISTATLDVSPTAAPPKIDGVISPGEWDGAAHSDAFRQIEPQEDSAPGERTEFWMTFDPDYIYVGVRSHDSAGRAGVRAYSMQHDQDNGSDDLVRLVFDTYNRENDGYYFALSAAGGRQEGLIQNKQEQVSEWDSIWFGRTTIDETGWTAEFAIPAKSISFDPTNETWGFDVARAVRRTQEVIRWAGRARNKPTTSLPNLGTIRGITGLKQGRGIDFKPFASFTRRSDPQGAEKANEFKPGFDLVWHMTPSLAATFTVNTDFADADVDERQVNLGRFSLFFPEKRSFFTQDSSIFTFAGLRRSPLPFFSRRIGLAADGSRVDVLGGLKLTGRAGPWTLGVLDTQVASHAGVDSKNLLAGRVARQVGDESSAGIVFTNGDPRSNGNNTLVGADFNYVNNSLPGKKSLTVRSGLQYTDSDLAGGAGSAATLSVDFPNEPYGLSWRFSRVSSRYDPALGFVSRTGVANTHLVNTYNLRSDTRWLRLTQFFAETDATTDLNLKPLDHEIWLGAFLETKHGDFANFWVNDGSETYNAPFAIRPGIVIPVGVHHWKSFQAQVGTSRSRPMDVYVRWHHGGFLTGDADTYQLNGAWRASNQLEFSMSQTLRDIRLPQGNFKVQVGSAKVVYTYSPDLQVSLLGQYDNFSESLGVNFRVKWTVQPGNEVFFIVNQGYDTSLDRFRPVQNDISIKGAWTLRF